MKEAFRDQRISGAKLVFIGKINLILEEYGLEGYTLTLRQLYYQLVARGIIENKTSEYSRLGRILVIARMNGLIDWSAIEDRIRQPYVPYWVTGIKGAIADTVRQYRLDRQKGQENYIEVWTEKDAVSNVLKRVTRHFHIRLMVNRGYSSCSAMKEAYERLDLTLSEGQHPVIIYVGDHDPSGLDMVRDIKERLEEFGAILRVKHVALTREQVEEIKPPPNPAKITDPRAKWYIAEHGPQSWELDALKPSSLESIVRKQVEYYVNLDIFQGMIEKEKEDKNRMRRSFRDE